ncbi:MAG: glycosyltransferase family 4 protein [Fusobacteriaceae bacterium]
MKILLDGRLISDKPTGISRYSIEMIKIYQNYYGYENVEVIINEDLKEKPFKFIKTNLKPFNMLHFFYFHRFLKKIDADVYHTLYHNSSFFKDKTKKNISTFHDIGHKVLKMRTKENIFKDILSKLGIEVILRRTLKNSDIIISVSETTRKDVKKFYNYESILIPEGINVIEVNDEKVEGIIEKNFFLYVGNSKYNKNLKFLINTFLNSKTKLKLVLVGTNNDLSINNSKIKSLGFVSENQLSWLYKNCEAFIFPSLYEGFGLPVLEALHKKSKVYCSTGGSLIEFSNQLVKKFSPYESKELKYLLENTEKIKFDEKVQLDELKKYEWKKIEKIVIKNLFEKIKK